MFSLSAFGWKCRDRDRDKRERARERARERERESESEKETLMLHWRRSEGERREERR